MAIMVTIGNSLIKATMVTLVTKGRSSPKVPVIFDRF